MIKKTGDKTIIAVKETTMSKTFLLIFLNLLSFVSRRGSASRLLVSGKEVFIFLRKPIFLMNWLTLVLTQHKYIIDKAAVLILAAIHLQMHCFLR